MSPPYIPNVRDIERYVPPRQWINPEELQYEQPPQFPGQQPGLLRQAAAAGLAAQGQGPQVGGAGLQMPAPPGARPGSAIAPAQPQPMPAGALPSSAPVIPLNPANLPGQMAMPEPPPVEVGTVPPPTPQAPQAERPGAIRRGARSIGRGLASFFGSGEGMTPEQRASGGWDALMDAGLAMMATSGPRGWGQPTATITNTLAAGLLSGRQGYAQRASEARRSNWLDEARAGIGGDDLQGMSDTQWDDLMLGAMQHAPDMVPYLSEVRKSMAAAGGGTWKPFGYGKQALIGRGGEILEERDVPTSPQTITPRPVTDAQGNSYMGAYYPGTGDEPGTWIDTSTGEEIEGVGPPMSADMKDKQTQAVMFYTFMTPIAEQLDTQPAPTLISERVLDARAEGSLIGSALWGTVSPDQQLLFSDAVRFGEAWLRLTTGAAYNTSEYKNAMLMFVPMAKDSEQLLKRKGENRRQLIDIMKIIAAGRRLSYSELEILAERQGLNLYGQERYLRHGGQISDPNIDPLSGEQQSGDAVLAEYGITPGEIKP